MISSARAYMCNNWPVGKLLLCEASNVKAVAVLLWQELHHVTMLDSSGCSACTDQGSIIQDTSPAITSLIPDSVRKVLQNKSWVELAVQLDIICDLQTTQKHKDSAVGVLSTLECCKLTATQPLAATSFGLFFRQHLMWYRLGLSR
jgi:hypothetical protein